MAYGDVGGSVTELVITCVTETQEKVNIAKGDAVRLVGPYTVSNDTREGNVIFGQALASTTENGASIPVKVRGICVFEYVGLPPSVSGESGVEASYVAGKVKLALPGAGRGINLKVNTADKLVHVLL